MPRLFLVLVAGLALVAIACGDDDDSPTPTAAPTNTVLVSGAASPTATPGVTLPPGVSGEPQSLPTDEITFETDDGIVALTVEIADDGAEQGLGLMFREEMPEDHGMLFVFGAERGTSFYMKNTLIPLSVAFINDDGTIANIQDMEPLSEDSHPSPEPVSWALEVNQGWFERNGVEVGDVMTVLGD